VETRLWAFGFGLSALGFRYLRIYAAETFTASLNFAIIPFGIRPISLACTPRACRSALAR
jgi:hypothetical protein